MNNLPKRLCLSVFSILLLVHVGCVRVASDDHISPPAFGWLEQVRVYPPGILMHAKLDTGADNCSLHAENIKKFKKDKENWVSFEISNRYGVKKAIEGKILRIAKVKKKGGGIQKRPVVRIGLCLGNSYESIECNLVNRAHFQNPVLVGRNFLAGSALVNSSETFTTTPNCSSSSSIDE